MDSSSTLTYEDYTVGWLCAATTERIAACELLEETHRTLTCKPYDNNAYSFGRIGDHNVVIAGLPNGKYGTSSAATVAKDLLRSFSSIRIRLMVGIGGGAPSHKHDIRLGDVVVSSPSGTTGGIVYYDFGKVVQEKEFERTGSLNAPPTALLTALQNIQNLHKRNGHRIVESIASMVQQNRRLRKDYEHPGAENDRLYAANYVHVQSGQLCARVCGDAALITREPRSENQDDPEIHYGLIASADKLMKDALIRDTLSNEFDVLCFEMEAAGLMDNFPCLVVRGICDYADTHKNDQWQGYAAATAAAYAKELLQAMPGQQVITTNRLVRTVLQPAPSAPQKGIFTVPFERDKHFVGREQIITQIEEKLQEQYRISLSGWGGMGKSQIAIEYAYRFRERHPHSHVFWVYAANTSRFSEAYQNIARRLKLPRYDDPAVDVRELVSNWLDESDTQWLMILDNADDTGLFFSSDNVEACLRETTALGKPLINYLPTRLSSSKSLLITTRRRNLGQDLSNGEQCIEVPSFDLQEARLLLWRSKDLASGDNSQESAELLGILEYIPLAITQAAAFIRRNQMSLSKYLAALKKGDENLKDFLSAELQDARRARGFPNAVFRTWMLSFNQIRDQEPHAAEILSLMALLDRREIPESLLKDPQDRDIDISTALGTLKTFALIVQEADGQTFAMHRLVQLSIHDWLGKADRFPDPEYENTKTCQRLYPHAQAVLRYKLGSESCIKARGDLLYMVGSYDLDQQNHNVAEMKISEAFTLYEEVVGKNSADSLSCMDLLGIILDHQGRYKEAKRMHKETLRLKETLLGKDHPATLESMCLIAKTLNRQGKYKKAVELHMETLKLRETVLGKNHVETIRTMNDLASALGGEGKYKEAEELTLQVLKLQETIQGKQHPNTLLTMHYLEWILECQCRYEEAERMLLQVLEIEETVLGKKHPHTLDAIWSLAELYHTQKRYEEAEKLFLQMFGWQETVLGKKHPDTLDTAGSLAKLYQTQQRYEEAEKMFLQVLELQEMVLGKKHPDTLVAVWDLAKLYQIQQRYEEAEKLFLQVLELQETVLGKKHPDTLDTDWDLAELYHTQQGYEEAELLYQRASTGFQETLGPDHPDTLCCARDHESLLKELDINRSRIGE